MMDEMGPGIGAEAILSGPIGLAAVETFYVPPEMRAHGMESAREVRIDRATIVVTVWAGGMTIVGTFCGGGGPYMARAKALQRALENGLRLKARWAAQRGEADNG